MITPDLNPSYAFFHEQSESQLLLEHIQDARERARLAQLDQEQIKALEPLWLLSDYVHQQCVRFPHWLDDLLVLETLPESPSQAALMAGEAFFALEPEACPEDEFDQFDEASLLKRLRLYRHWWMVRLIALDIQQRLPLAELTRRLSGLADACVNASLAWTEQNYLSLYGRALDSNGLPQSLIVIGMGKLGGHELNLSSDIDLIFAF
ncbi:MAG: bifunctional [glutamate--ammonia ligase]-adenylyl-L-tyrosine phosphorylase/[glutamate--ammonia-ligase] adenylyltransferase, partial [Marinomonas sp.]